MIRASGEKAWPSPRFCFGPDARRVPSAIGRPGRRTMPALHEQAPREALMDTLDNIDSALDPIAGASSPEALEARRVGLRGKNGTGNCTLKTRGKSPRDERHERRAEHTRE